MKNEANNIFFHPVLFSLHDWNKMTIYIQNQRTILRYLFSLSEIHISTMLVGAVVLCSSWFQ